MNDVQILGGGGAYLPPTVRSALLPVRAAAGARTAPAAGARSIRASGSRAAAAARSRNIWSPNTYAQVRLLRLRHEDAGPRLRAVRRAPPVQRDQARPRRELGVPRAADRGRSGRRAPRRCRSRSRASKQHHHRQLPRLPRDAQPRAVPAAVRIYNSSDIRFRNVHVNAESGYGICDANGCGTFLRASKFPYENAIQDVTHHLEVREREFAVLDVPAAPARPRPPTRRPWWRQAPGVEKLEGGFYSISGATVDANGTLYFVDHHQHRIFSWSAAHGLTVVRHDAARSGEPRRRPVGPPARAVVRRARGHGLLVRARLARRRDHVLPPQPSAPHPGAAVVLPVNVLGQRRVREPARSRHLRVHDARADVRARRDDARGPRSTSRRTAACSCPPVRVFQQGPRRFVSGHGRDRLALVQQSRRLRLHHGHARAARLRRERRGESDLQRDGAARRHARRPEAVRRARRRERRRGTADGQRLRRQRPDLRLRPVRQADRPDRRARAADRRSCSAAPIAARCSSSRTTRSTR